MDISGLTQLVPSGQIVAVPSGEDEWGNLARHIVFAQHEQEIAHLLAYANDQRLRVIVQGSGSKRGWGGSVKQADFILSLAQMRGVIQHSPGDMTVRILPGTTLHELNETLASHGQYLPLDPTWPEVATLGGIVAANDSGPKRCRFGSARDFVIGLRIVLADGQVIRSGGQVVKNVAGYDLNKLFIGSMGTLGVISEITLKLRPLPQYERLLVVYGTQEQLHILRSFASQVLDSPLEPISLELLNPTITEELCGTNQYGLAIGFADGKQAVDYQAEWIIRQLPQTLEVKRMTMEEGKDWWARLARLAPAVIPERAAAEKKIGIKAGTKNMDVFPLIASADQLCRISGVKLEAHGGLAHGISKLYLSGEPTKVTAVIREIRHLAQELNGYAVLQHAPAAVREQVGAWGEISPVLEQLFRGIKQKLDPHHTLNDQRYVGGI